MRGARRPHWSVFAILILLGATAAAFAPMASTLRDLKRQSQPLLMAELPHGLQSLSLSTRAEATAAWTSEDFFVPPSLWGGGFGGRFLGELLRTLRARGVTRCEVTVKGPGAHASRAQWDERRAFVDFYRQSGFQIDEARSNNTEAILSKGLAE